MKTLLAASLLLLVGCTSLKLEVETGPDGKTIIRKITRHSFMAGAAFETIDIPGLGTLRGYSNDGGKGSLEEVGGIVGQAVEGGVRGALKAQGK